jgi:hypothetical protein
MLLRDHPLMCGRWRTVVNTKRLFWMMAVPVVVLLMFVVALWTVGINHQGRTLSGPPPARERLNAAPTEGAIGPVIPRERRYKVEAVSFHAIDESGPDWLGSDEIYARWRDPKTGLVGGTGVYDVDTGDTVMLRQRCILPMNGPPGTVPVSACLDAGVPGPFEFEVGLFEDDQPWPPIPLPSFCPGIIYYMSPRCYGDDLVDQKMVSFTTAELEAAMPNVGDTFQEDIAIRTFCGVPESKAGLTVYGCAATGPDYRFTYRLTRLPDKDLTLHP